jgi:DNA-binding transcriptional regulator YhcF (GntR family)
MDFLLNRSSGVPVRDQLVAQMELKILSGHYAAGQKLPSVRSLARRLGLHPNTVQGAYRDLEATRHVVVRQGAGVFVICEGARSLADAHGLDEMIRVSLRAAFQQGHSTADIRAAVERWLRAAPPGRIVTVDPCGEMAEVMAAEIKSRLSLEVGSAALSHVAADPSVLDGSLVVTLPYHTEAIARICPGLSVETVHLAIPAKLDAAVTALPAGAMVMAVSHAPSILPFALKYFHSLRGDELLIEVHLVRDGPAWRRLLPAADLVVADALSAPTVRKAAPRKLFEAHLIEHSIDGRLEDALVVVGLRGAPKVSS